ncbi:MAG: GGDEF domain-containing protein [Myxococcota bacterium]|nr:GGDEF domain-containing protein [Myxococcota bacterium]
MTDEAKPRARRAALRTKPFDDDSNSLREALQRELRRAVAPSLVVILGPDVGARVVLHRSVEVGRDPSCELPLRDENVSWRHARIEDRGDGEWVAVDLASTNGTLVDGHPCDGSVLKPGSHVFLGTTVIELQQDALRDAQAAELERLLSIDDLSGLWVKRRFDAQLASSVDAVLAGDVPTLAVIVMDMDGVKEINDTHGHLMGAFVIGEAGHVIGRVIESEARARGFATRFGGDEFAAALPGLNKEDALAMAEALRVAVVGHVYEKDGVRVRPGLSCGVATMPGDASDAESLFRAADQAMYRAKRAGKNRVAG